jgi:hypothetical protein
MTTVYARFGTLLGAVVELLPSATEGYLSWRCLGCHASSVQTGSAAREAANAHAAECRALPQPEEAPTA